MTRTAALLVSCVLAAAPSARAVAQELRAGASAVDVTPREFPFNMPGGFTGKQAARAHDPLHARALVLSDGKVTLAMAVLDTLGAPPELLDEAKAIASEKTGIPVSRMLISSTHTHSAPPSNTKEGPAPAVAYRKLLVAGLARSIVEAHAALRPASLGVATHPLPEEVFNRRWYLKPGKMPPNPFGGMDRVKMNPGNRPDILDRPAGPTDPDVTVISVLDAKRKPLAIYANYALHYVGGVPKDEVSADYYGEFARVMPVRMRAGEGFVAMMSNGASGDINNIPFGQTRPPRAPYEQISIVARKAADAAWFAHRKIGEHRSDLTLAMAERGVVLKYRKPTDGQVARAKEILAIRDEAEVKKLPKRAQAYARRTLSAAKRPETLTVTLQAIRIGDLAVCAIPFEVLVEIGLELKQRSGYPRTMVVGLANGRHGYLPPPNQHELGGYETWLGTNHVQKDASVILVRNLLEMLGELKEGK